MKVTDIYSHIRAYSDVAEGDIPVDKDEAVFINPLKLDFEIRSS